MKYAKKVLALLFVILMAVLCLRAVVWAIEPFIPVLILTLVVGGVLVVVLGVLFKRSW